MEITQSEERILKRKEYSLRDLWDNIMHINIWSIKVPEGEEWQKGIKNIFE